MQYDEAFLERVVESVAHPIFVKDREFRFVLVNRASCELTGYSREEMLGKTDFDLFPEAEASGFRKIDTEVFTKKTVMDVAEEGVTDALGRKRVLATTKVPLEDARGNVTHLVGITHDITYGGPADAHKQRSDESERQLAEATKDGLMRKERLAVLGQLAGGVAHQIRNPLAAIKNAAYVIERLTRAYMTQPEDQTALKNALEVIHDEVDGANRTITALLDHARVRHATRVPTDISDVVELALGATRVPPDVHVDRVLPPLPRVAADLEQAKSALVNVFQNACEAMPNGGRLRIEARREGKTVALYIQDTGPGVAAALRTRLFEPLVTTKPLGFGLGLVTARTLLASQGGELDLLDLEERESGASFRVRLLIATT